MANEIIKTTASFLGRTKVTFVQNAPKILVGLGIVSGSAALITAIKATLKAQPIIEEMKTDVADIHCELDDAEESGQDPSTLKKNLTDTYLHFAGDMLKEYWPTILLAGCSCACFVGSHGIMMSRNTALATACAAAEEEYKRYRQRVADKIGTEAEQAIYRNERVEEYEDTVVDEETGEVKTEKKTKKVFDVNRHSAFFDHNSTEYISDPKDNYNLMFLEIQESMCNDKIRSQGFLFENDVRKLLGVPQTPEGQRFGWIYDPNGPTRPISFGIKDYNAAVIPNIINEPDMKGIYLEFNVQGDIMDKVRW